MHAVSEPRRLVKAEGEVQVLHGGAAGPLAEVVEARGDDACTPLVVAIHEDLWSR